MRRTLTGRLAVLTAAALTATLLAPGSPAAAAQTTIVIDNSDSDRFTASEAWGVSSWSDQGHGDDYRFADPNTGASDAAWYRADIPSTDTYRVEVWYPADPGYNNATPYVVVTPNGNQTVHVNQRNNGGRWVSLGVFPLAAGDYDVVGVSRWTNGTGYVIADAVRITSAEADEGDWALPVPRDAVPRSEYSRTHHTYPAIDLRVPTGTPAYAVLSGTVTRIDDSGCGLGISLLGHDGATYNYCHFSAWSVATGATVAAGERIGTTGNTGNSSGPHLHLQIRANGTLRCPQPMMLAIYDGTPVPPSSSLPTSGCTH